MSYRELHLTSLKNTLIRYMKAKIQDEDWHAVSDAANDLREVDLELRLMQKEKDEVPST